MLEELQTLLKETHLKLREVSARTGLSLSLINAIKAGTKPNPTIDTYQKLRDGLLAARAELDGKAA